MQLQRNQFHFPAGQFRIGFLSLDALAFDGDDEFAARLLGFGVRRRLRLFVEDHLHDAGAVANVEEEQIAEVAAPRYPAHDEGILAVVRGANSPQSCVRLRLPRKSRTVPVLSNSLRSHAERSEASQL